MSKILKIIPALIYIIFIIINILDVCNFISVDGVNYPQIGRTHTYVGYIAENILVGAYCTVGIVLLLSAKTNKLKILIPHFTIFIIYILISAYMTRNYW